MLISSMLANLVATISVVSAQDRPKGAFQITNFAYTCNRICSWSFDVAVSGNANNHPGFSTPVRCSGRVDYDDGDDDDGNDNDNDDKFDDYEDCSDVFSSPGQSVHAYITRNRQLRLRYEVDHRRVDDWNFHYEGNRAVRPRGSQNMTPRRFTVGETRAYVDRDD